MLSRRMKAAYTYFREHLALDAAGHGMSPLHQALLRSMIDLGCGWRF
jgi:hypothetical protein